MKFMKKAIFLTSLIAALAVGFVSCNSDVAKADFSNAFVSELLEKYDTGSYMGRPKNIKLSTNTKKTYIILKWTEPTAEEDPSFQGVRIYCNQPIGPTEDTSMPIAEISKGTTSWTSQDLELDQQKRYTFTIFAIGKEDSGKIVHTLNPWYGTVKLGANKNTEWGYIGRGYDAINGDYFSSNGVKAQIIDFDEDYFPELKEDHSSEIRYSAGTSIVSYKKDFNQSVGVEGSYGGFSGSIDVDFSLSESSESETGFASAYGNYKMEHEWLEPGDSKLATLKEHLTMGFTSDINDTSVSPKELFAFYGTHVMLDTWVGGRFVSNYQVNKTSKTTAKSIKAAVKASYGGISGSSSTGVGSENASSKEDMTLTGYTRGGKAVKFSTPEEANEAWGDWTEYLNDPENKKTWSLVDAPDTIKYENNRTGIWLFANDEARREEIYKYYEEQCLANADALSNAFATGKLKIWLHSFRCTYHSDGNSTRNDIEVYWTLKIDGNVVDSVADGSAITMNDDSYEYYNFKEGKSQGPRPTDAIEACKGPIEVTVSKRNPKNVIIRLDMYEDDGKYDDTICNQEWVLKYNKEENVWYDRTYWMTTTDGLPSQHYEGISSDSANMEFYLYTAWVEE